LKRVPNAFAERAVVDRRGVAGPLCDPCCLAIAIDAFVERIYRTGFVQSFILHVTLLLILALTATHVDQPRRPVALAMRFDGAQEPLLHDEEFVPLESLAAPAETERFEAIAPELSEPALESEVAVALHEVEVGPREPDRLPKDVDLVATITAIPATTVPSSRPHPRAAATVGSGLGDHGGGFGRGGAGGRGIGGELGRRLRAAGAGTGDVQVSIRWDNVNDIDVHVRVEPFGPGPASMINFANRRGICGGTLDVDANARPSTMQPVENIFWAAGRAPYGRFTVAVHHFRSWSGQAATPVEVAVLVDGAVHRFEPVVVYGGPLMQVITFDRKPGGRVQVTSSSSSSPVQ
jgi:hypothetical protein